MTERQNDQWEAKMQKEYQDNMSQQHASRELIEKTKQAMCQEPKRKTVKIQYMAAGIAAAVVLVITVPFLFMGRTNENQISKQLGNDNSGAVKIERQNDITLEVSPVAEMPEEFYQSAEEYIVNDYPVTIMNDTENGCLKAYLVKDENGYLMIAETADLDAFMKAIGRELAQLD